LANVGYGAIDKQSDIVTEGFNDLGGVSERRGRDLAGVETLGGALDVDLIGQAIDLMKWDTGTAGMTDLSYSKGKQDDANLFLSIWSGLRGRPSGQER
jgi:hypothetical protein